MSTAAAILLFSGVIAYAVFGGADFGAGFWDLVAGGTIRGGRPREVIDHSIGPVWEANHVWLIFTFVVLWTCFPEAFSSITLTLFVPLTLAALGVVLRGSGFAFRKAVLRTHYRRVFGAAFAISSVLVPYCFGAVVGGIASGRVPAGGQAGDAWSSWVNPTSILGGGLSVILAAYLAAVLLVHRSQLADDAEMTVYFRLRAEIAAVTAGVVAFGGVFILRSDAHFLFEGLTSRALPVVLVSTALGLSSLLLLLRSSRLYPRFLAVGAVAGLVLAWGVAQWDYMLPTSLTVTQAAAPTGTIRAVLVAAGLALLLVVPGFVLLYTLDQRGLLPGEGVDGVQWRSPMASPAEDVASRRVGEDEA